MALSNNNKNSLVKGISYTFAVNCKDCQFNSVGSGCVYSNRCPFMELPKPSSDVVKTKCIICGEVFIRPIFSINNICDECKNKLNSLMEKQVSPDE